MKTIDQLKAERDKAAQGSSFLLWAWDRDHAPLWFALLEAAQAFSLCGTNHDGTIDMDRMCELDNAVAALLRDEQ